VAPDAFRYNRITNKGKKGEHMGKKKGENLAELKKKYEGIEE
jgi:hypothetical protein